MKRGDATRLAWQLMTDYGVGREQGWTFQMGRAVTQFGSCNVRTRTIRLSGPLTDTNDRAQVEDTIRHEIAHALVWQRQVGRRGQPHGPEWQRIAREVGARPQACGPGEPPSVPPPYLATCTRCERESRRYRRPSRPVSCGRCSADGKYDASVQLVWIDTRKAANRAA